jgi:AcrR family transcriptional regulator
VTREEGERRLVEATMELARESPFGELSAREIARRADMNHGYVHVWFGGKAGLLDAACIEQARRLVHKLAGSRLSVAALKDPEVTFRLLGRLQTEPGGVELARRRERPMVELVAAQLQQTAGLEPGEARTLATLAVAAVAGVATVGEVLDFDVAGLVDSWPRVTSAFRMAQGA